jgi:Fe2+ or Zn2+ uptake regulation protein
MTGQRRIITRILSDAADHPDVEEVYRRANAIDERISLSTVYRTVRLLERKGILARHDCWVPGIAMRLRRTRPEDDGVRGMRRTSRQWTKRGLSPIRQA